MPTASKLVAAILFAALSWFVSDLVKPLLPGGTQTALLSPINALIGLVLGWRVMGRTPGDSTRTAMGYGLTTIFLIAFWCVFLWAGYQMTINSTRLRYDGPIEAVQDMFMIMIQYGRLLATPAVIGSMLTGGLIFGWITEQVARRYS